MGTWSYSPSAIAPQTTLLYHTAHEGYEHWFNGWDRVSQALRHVIERRGCAKVFVSTA